MIVCGLSLVWIKDNYMEKEKAYVALSGGGEGESLVVKIEEQLSKFLEVDHYKKRISEGRRYSIPRLYEEIGTSLIVIVIIDEKYLTESEHCQEEIKFIMHNGILNRRVYPIITQNCPNIFDIPINTELKNKAKNFIEFYIKNKLKNEGSRRIDEFHHCVYTSNDFIENLKNENWVSTSVDELISKIKKNRNEYINQEDLIKNIPLGVEEIREDKNEKLKYKKYLSNNELPYISRSRFKQEKLDVNSIFQTEKDYYNSTFHEKNNYEGIFISGEGGVGKTRLMYEIGREAQSQGWIVYQIFPNFEGWKSLKLDTSKQYCFLFDYVEENDFFENNIIDILDREYQNTTIRIVANARNTYLLNNEVNDSLFNIVDLDISSKDEHNYLKYVILEIFQGKKLLLNEKQLEVLEKYIGKPSFAVFLLHGLLKDKTIDFHDISEFSNFIKKRLALTFKKESFLNIESKIFHFLFSLPIKAKMSSDNMDDLIIAPLEHDGWIEHDRKTDMYKSAYNDTIMDEVLIAYLNKREFKREVKLKKELEAIFDFSIKYSKFSYVFRALDRVSRKFIIVDKEPLLIELFSRYIEKIKEIKSIFGKSSLFSNVTKIKFFDRYKIVENSDFIYTMTLGHALRNINATHQDYILIKELSEKWINSNLTHDNFSYVSSGFLEKIGSIEIVKPTIEKWINSNIGNKWFDFVISRYLEKVDSIESTQKTIETWIESNIEHENFTFIIDRYLRKVDSIEATRETIEEWINHNSTHESFTFVINRYLRKVDSIEATRETIEEWINNNPTHESFTFVIPLYLKHIKSFEIIKKVIVKWLNKDCKEQYLRKNIPLYLNAGGNIHDISEAYKKGISVYYPEKFRKRSRKLIEYYFKEKGSLEQILKWVGNQNNYQFGFIIYYYLNYGGSIDKVENILKLSLVEWIHQNNESDCFIPMFDAYLENFMTPKELEFWITENFDSQNLSYVIGLCLEQIGYVRQRESNEIKSLETKNNIMYQYLHSNKSLTLLNKILIKKIKAIEKDNFLFYLKIYLNYNNIINSNLMSYILKWIAYNHTDINIGLVVNIYLTHGGNIININLLINKYFEDKIKSIHLASIIYFYIKHKGKSIEIKEKFNEYIYLFDENYFSEFYKIYVRLYNKQLEKDNEIEDFLNYLKQTKIKIDRGAQRH